jgi:succinylglutamate desuccinylase
MQFFPRKNNIGCLAIMKNDKLAGSGTEPDFLGVREDKYKTVLMETALEKKTDDKEVTAAAHRQRIIGEYSGEPNGPVVIFVGGIHGNEPAAVIALEAVFKTLRQLQPSFSGKFVALRGNITALSHSIRFMEEDLNRIWQPERIRQLTESSGNFDQTVEQREQRVLFDVLQPYFRNKHLPLYLIDLHTTSAKSAPFVILADTYRNRRFALNLPTAIILGLEELLEGTIMHYAGDLGFCTLAFESGQHRDEASIHNHIAAIWIFLSSAGCLSKSDIPGFEKHKQRLKNVCRHLPRVFEIKLRYRIQPGEEFRMQPGYENFQPIIRGEVLAQNRDGEIRSPLKGNIFMPLYQAQGNDGFFIIRRIQYFWLKISEWMRRLHIL